MSDAPPDIYEPAYVADLFDRCSSNYRLWSSITSFGVIALWRRQCVRRLGPVPPGAVVVDLMAGTGEVWPHLLRHAPDVATITAIDISHAMHERAVARLHATRASRITHIEADALTADLPAASADCVISTFGL